MLLMIRYFISKGFTEMGEKIFSCEFWFSGQHLKKSYISLFFKNDVFIKIKKPRRLSLQFVSS